MLKGMKGDFKGILGVLQDIYVEERLSQWLEGDIRALMSMLKFGMIGGEPEVVKWSLRCLSQVFQGKGQAISSLFFDEDMGGVEIVIRAVQKYPNLRVELIGFMIEYSDNRKLFETVLK